MANPDNERTSEIDGIETRQAKTLQSESQQQGTQGNNDINNGRDMEKYLNEGPSLEDIGRGWGEINTNQEERKSIFKQYREFKKINKRYIKKLNEFSNEVLNIKGDSIDRDVMSILSPPDKIKDFDKIIKDNIKSIIKDIKEQPFFNMNDIKNIVLRKSKERDRFGLEYIRARTIAQAIAAYDSNKAMANIINNNDIFSNLTGEELTVVNYAKGNRGLYEFDLMDAIYNYSLDKNKYNKAVHNLRKRIEKKPEYNSENNQGEITFFSKAQIKELMSKSQISNSYGPSTSNVPIDNDNKNGVISTSTNNLYNTATHKDGWRTISDALSKTTNDTIKKQKRR